MNEKLQNYFEHIFASKENFEKVIFEATTHEDMIEIIHTIAEQMVYESELSEKINFIKLKNISQLDLSDMAFFLVRMLFNEVVEWFMQYTKDEDEIKRLIQEDKLKMYFLHQLAMSYYFDHEEIYLSTIIHSYYEVLRQAPNFRQIPKIGHDAVTGTSKVRSLFLNRDGSVLVRRADQIWMRIDQASKTKKRKVFALTAELKKHKDEVEDIQLRIKGYEESAKLTKQSLGKFSPDYMRNVLTEDDPKYALDRKILAAIPAGELAYELELRAEKAIVGARTAIAKDEFKKIKLFFEKCKINNSPNALSAKRTELEEKLPRKKQQYLESVAKYQTAKDEPLENFDEQLAKITQVFVENLKRFPVRK